MHGSFYTPIAPVPSLTLSRFYFCDGRVRFVSLLLFFPETGAVAGSGAGWAKARWYPYPHAIHNALVPQSYVRVHSQLFYLAN